MNPPTCPECREPMEVGHLLDHSQTRFEVVQWVAGPVDWAGYRGLFDSKLDNHELYRVVSFRCPRCGELKSFARSRTMP